MTADRLWRWAAVIGVLAAAPKVLVEAATT